MLPILIALTIIIVTVLGADQVIDAVNGARVCFNARAFLTNYYFSAPYDGQIRGIKFSYLGGSVSCWDECTGPANWGCSCDNYFYVSVIEVDDKETWYPKNGQGGVSNYESLDCDGTKHTDKGVTVKRYRVPNEDGRNSNYWELKANVREVRTTNRFAVQYGEGACANVKTNSGQACGRVQFIYSKIDTDQPTPQPTRSPIPVQYLPARPQQTCFSADKYAEFEFTAPVAGEIAGVKLVYDDGTVSCVKGSGQAKWGCGGNTMIYISMIEKNTLETWYPTATTDGVSEDTMEPLECKLKDPLYACSVQRYQMDGYNGINSNELTWFDGGNIRQVTSANQWSIQYGEGCCEDVKTNSGAACADVYFIYSNVYTDSPTKDPTKRPTKRPTDVPTKFPTDSPIPVPTAAPNEFTLMPSKAPTTQHILPGSPSEQGSADTATAGAMDDLVNEYGLIPLLVGVTIVVLFVVIISLSICMCCRRSGQKKAYVHNQRTMHMQMTSHSVPPTRQYTGHTGPPPRPYTGHTGFMA